MNNKKIILTLFILVVFAARVYSQNTLPFTQNNFCFDQLIKVNAAATSNAKNMVVADLNNDLKKEVIIADGTNGVIKIFSFLTATSTFTLQNYLTVPGGFGNGKQRAVDVGFFNADTFIDLVFTTDSFIYVYKNNNNFNFTLLNKLPIIQQFISQEHYLKVDNINNAGSDDFYFISANASFGSGISILPYRNTGSSFSADPPQKIFKSLTAPFASSYFDISIGDVDNNGLKDVMLTCNQIADSVVFLENSSTSTLSFNLIPVYLPPTFPHTSPDYLIRNCEMADINSDGKMDFMFNGNTTTGDKLAIYAGFNTFSLSFHVDIPTVFTFDDFKLSEINSDGKLDFVGVGNFAGFSAMVVYPGNGNNITYFNPSTTIAFPYNVKSDELQLTDIDANGINDIIFKPWKLNSDLTYMIPNFTYKLNASPPVSNACSTLPATLTVTSGIINTSNSYQWKDSLDNIVFSGSVFTTTAPGNYYAYYDVPMYTTDCQLTSDTLSVIDVSPVISLSSGNLVTVCNGNTITTTASGAVTYSWTAPSSVTQGSNPTFSLQVFSSADYTISGFAANGCRGTTILNVHLFPTNTDQINVSQNPVCLGESTTLSFPSATSYTWNNTTFTPTFTVSPVTTTSYSLDIIDLNGCRASKSIFVKLDENCNPKIYTGITANGDGNNDFFRIDNIENFKNNHVIIYNRWGLQVFETYGYNNIANYWPNSVDGNNFPPSTYFFVVNFGDGSEIKKGWVELIKN